MYEEDEGAKASEDSELEVKSLVEAAWSDAGLGRIGEPRARIYGSADGRRVLEVVAEIGGRRYLCNARVGDGEPSSPHHPAIILLLRCIVRDAARAGIPTDDLAPWAVSLVDRKRLLTPPTTADLADTCAGRTADRERADVLAYVTRAIRTARDLESHTTLVLLYESFKAARHEGAAEEERWPGA